MCTKYRLTACPRKKVVMLTLCIPGNPLTTFANSEDPDGMHLNAAFHQGLHCL